MYSEMLLELLDKNEYYFINSDCGSGYYSKEEMEEEFCSYCGDYHSAEREGNFKDLFTEDVVNQLKPALNTRLKGLDIENIKDYSLIYDSYMVLILDEVPYPILMSNFPEDVKDKAFQLLLSDLKEER